MSVSGFTIRPYRPADRARVLSFLEASYPAAAHKSLAEHFDWQFDRHPFGSSLDGYYLAWEGDTLVGQLATLRDRLQIDNQWREARWLCDLMIDPAQRGGLTALRLFQAVMQRDELLLAVGAGPATEPLYRALGWRRRTIAHTCYLPIRPRALLRMARATGREQSSAIVDMPGLVAALAGGVLTRVAPNVARHLERRAAHVVCELIDDFPPEIETLLAAALPRLGVTPLRTRESLRWRFSARPLSGAPIARRCAWLALDRATGAALGYLAAQIVERPQLARWLEVVDYVALPEDASALVALQAAAMRCALEAKADFIRWRLSREEHLRHLASPWWREHTLPITDEVFVFSRDRELLARLNSAPWHLTSLVSDRALG